MHPRFSRWRDETFAKPIPEEGFERSSRWVIFPRRAFEGHGEINERLISIAKDYAQDEPLASFNPQEQGGDASFSPRLGVVAGGVSASYVREALRRLEELCGEQGVQIPSYRFWQVGTPYPFPAVAADEFTCGLDRIIVFEELDHVIEDELTVRAGRTHASYEVLGKLTGDTRDRGENDVDDAITRLASFFGLSDSLGESLKVPAPFDEPLPVRPPVLCAGCPRRDRFYAVKRALGKTPAVLCGDIGCYTLGNAKPLDAIDTCLCMGAGITMAQGFSVVEPDKKQLAFVGDSTFFASGLTGIANAVYNGHDITVCVLDNATTAMTGSQPHPGTGVTLMGPHRKPISIEAVLKALGVECIVHADPLDLEGSIDAAKRAIDFEGPSAILFESPCVQLVKPKASVNVNTDTCTGCKKCITEIGCPGLGFDQTRKGAKSKDRGQAFVDASLCNGCGLCVQVCPFKAIELPGNAEEKEAPHA